MFIKKKMKNKVASTINKFEIRNASPEIKILKRNSCTIFENLIKLI